MSVLNPGSFEVFRENLEAALKVAEGVGIPDAVIERQAAAVGDYLSANVKPGTPEQKLLKELWDSGDEREQRALAGMLVKWVRRGNA